MMAAAEVVSDDGRTGMQIPAGETLIGGNAPTDAGKDVDSELVLDFEKEFEGHSREEEKLDGRGGEPVDGHANALGMSVAELVAKARAPVKKEFLAPAAVRLVAPNGGVTGAGSNNGVWDEKTSSRIAPEKKSKRQQKRDRLQAKKSPENICAIVARTGDVNKCPYGTNCRFNHDLEAYKAQKPPDVPGNCPFLDYGGPCSYGISCRFAGTHKEHDGDEISQKRVPKSVPNEQNGLDKELQKLLWKNMALFPKADAQLQAMGLMNKAFKLRKVDGKEDEIHRTGKVADEETLNGDHGPGAEDHRNTTKSTLDGTERIRVDSECSNDQLAKSNVDIEFRRSDVPDNLRLTAELEELSSLTKSSTLATSSPPQKRLRSEIDGAAKHPADVGEHNDVLKASDVHIDKDPFHRSSTVDVPSGDTLTGNHEVKEVKQGQSDDLNSMQKGISQSLYQESKLGVREKKIIDFRGKLYLAPLTTVGNLPFRRLCKSLGADITCGEMAMCTNLLQGQASEWALLRRHSSEDLFGVQICGAFPDHVARTAELIEQECTVDFIDINMGCPIDLVVNKGAGSCLLTRPQRLEQVVRATAVVMDNPLTLKLRMGYYEGRNCAHTLMPNLSAWGVSAVTIHGRTRQQRYSRVADWAYVGQCAAAVKGNLQVIGNGDVFAYTDWTEHLEDSGSNLSTCMIARGALIKPWLFTEIKEQRHWDISSGERLDILKQYVHSGLEHWGSDSKGVETTRHFLLEWLSYMHRYIPVGVLEVVPQRLNWRPPNYFGRNDLETMMASESAADWVRISELLLGPAPANFIFKPKHKSNAYDRPENG